MSLSAPVVIDTWTGRSAVRNIVAVVGLTVATAVSAQISIPLPFTPVPLTLQTFAVLAGAAALGATRSVIAQVSYLVLAIAGAPVLAGGVGGVQKVMGSTAGYLIGFVVASAVVGWISERGASRRMVSTAASYIAGSAIIYCLGATWLSIYSGKGFAWAVSAGVLPFLIGDAIKALAAGATLPTLWRLAK